jgi:hypothetical protein
MKEMLIKELIIVNNRVAGPKRRATLRNIMLGEVVKTFKPQK